MTLSNSLCTKRVHYSITVHLDKKQMRVGVCHKNKNKLKVDKNQNKMCDNV